MTTLVSTITIPGNSPKEKIMDLKEDLAEKIRELGDISFRLEYSKTMESKSGAAQKLMIGVCAPGPRMAIEAALVATDLLLPIITGAEE